MRIQAIILLSALLLTSCARNLKEDVTLNIDDGGAQHSFVAPEDANYFNIGDSMFVYNEITSDLESAFREKGNDVTVVSSTGEFTLRIISFSFCEYFTGESVTDPCDSSNTLHYDVSVIRGSMTCEVMNNFNGHSEIISADAESDEDVKDHPTIFQRLIGNDSCYTPQVSSAYPDAVKRRLVRRIHRYAMQSIKRNQ